MYLYILYILVLLVFVNYYNYVYIIIPAVHVHTSDVVHVCIIMCT